MGERELKGAGRLSIVASPIGHLGDVTLRALRTLRDADAVVAEDSRRSRRLLQAHGIARPVLSLPAFDEARRLEPLLERLRRGEHLALLSDAGMPTVSDPGQRLVAAARAEGVTVEVLPGPSAVLAAVATSGLPAHPFRFLGFLPRKGGRRQRALRSIAADPGATVFFEAPGRLAATLRELGELLPASRRLAVCRELTKRFEQVEVGPATALVERFGGEVLGEVTVVVEASGDPFARGVEAATVDAAQDASRQQREAEVLRLAAERLAAGEGARAVARWLAQQLGCSRRGAYQRLMAQVEERNTDR